MAESRIESEFLKQGIQCWAPVAKTQHDLLAKFNGGFKKVQIKHTRYKQDQGVVDIHLTSWGSSGSDYEDRRDYDETEVDYFAGYCSELNLCHLIPFDDCGSSNMYIRVDDAKRNDSRINWHKDYKFTNQIENNEQ